MFVINARVPPKTKVSRPRFLQLWFESVNFALQHVDKPDFPIDSQLRLVLMPAIAMQSSDRKRVADLQAYADQHIP
jgi:hypothetical protein